jgi:hypothetical protein
MINLIKLRGISILSERLEITNSLKNPLEHVVLIMPEQL